MPAIATIPARPEPITPAEIESKLSHLERVLRARKKTGILLVQEGAMRWLTGTRHQIIDIAPDAEGPVRALVEPRESGFTITVIADRIERPRVLVDTERAFGGIKDIGAAVAESLPSLAGTVALPGDGDYADTVGRIVRPLAGGTGGNQFAKLRWLAGTAGAVLAECAHQLEPGMNGARVRGMVFREMAERGVECNLILAALQGQETFLHPLCDERHSVARGSWIKLVVGARFADCIVSESVMVMIGRAPSPGEAASYRALQEAVMEYADLYRAGALEGDLYDGVGARFREIEKKHGIAGFGDSAYLHHLGGPTSPLGNRDFIIERGGSRRLFPMMQFAVNPVEGTHNLKAEVQGIVTGEGPPLMLDCSIYTPPSLMTFSEIASSGGAAGKVADLIVRD